MDRATPEEDHVAPSASLHPFTRDDQRRGQGGWAAEALPPSSIGAKCRVRRRRGDVRCSQREACSRVGGGRSSGNQMGSHLRCFSWRSRSGTVRGHRARWRQDQDARSSPVSSGSTRTAAFRFARSGPGVIEEQTGGTPPPHTRGAPWGLVSDQSRREARLASS